MRRLLPLLVLFAAGPAVAQDAAANAALQMRQMEIEAQQDLARQRAIAMQNDLNTLDAQIRTDRALRDTAAHNLDPQIPAPIATRRPLARLAGPYPSIPDSMLAASRKRVEEASRNRR